jgi:hypothetical protein
MRVLLRLQWYAIGTAAAGRYLLEGTRYQHEQVKEIERPKDNSGMNRLPPRDRPILSSMHAVQRGHV